MYQRDLFDPPKIWVAELDWEKVLEYYSLSDSLQVLTTEDILTTIITLIMSYTCNYVCVCVTGLFIIPKTENASGVHHGTQSLSRV